MLEAQGIFGRICSYIILNTISGLNNDHKNLMQEIEECLCELHRTSSKKNRCDQKDVKAASIPCGEPFASIGKVDSNSPSDIGVICLFKFC